MRACILTTLKHVSVVLLFVCGSLLILHHSEAVAQGDAPLKVTISALQNVPLESQQVSVPVMFKGDPDHALGAMVFAIKFDTSRLAFDYAEPAKLLNDCDWAHFSSAESSPGLIRMLATADNLSGTSFPSCYLTDSTEDTLLLLHFTVPTDTSFNCEFTRLDFFWDICTVNEFSDNLGLTTYVESSVFDIVSSQYRTRSDSLGTIDGLPNICMGGSLFRDVDFVTGGIEFGCIAPPYLIGDINLNGVPYEIADLVLFTNYLIYGIDVFTVNPEYQIAATDMNLDGEVLTIRDYAYLWRVITGETLPLGKASAAPLENSSIYVELDTLQQQLSFSYSEPLCVMSIDFDGEITPTSLQIDDMILEWNFDNGHTRMIIRGEYLAGIQGINPGPVFSYTGSASIVSIEVADWKDRNITVEMGAPPQCGDTNANGFVSVADLVAIINYIFDGGAVASPTAADTDCSGAISIADAVLLINYIFGGGPAPCAGCL